MSTTIDNALVAVIRTSLSRFARGAALFSLLIGATACQMKPSLSAGQAVFERHYNLDKAKLVDFKKTDGQELNAFGVKTYRMSFVATLECTAQGGCCLRAEPVVFGMYGSQCTRSVTAGTRYTTAGKIVFEKSEAGWSEKDFDLD